MSSNVNVVALSGNLTRDPETRMAGSMTITTFRLAVNDRRKNGSTGEWEDYANFIDCTIFGARGESLAKILKKGTKVSLAGKLRWSSWEKDGQKKSKIEVIAEEVDILSSPKKQAQDDLYPSDMPF